jgi:hypothetical protein
VVEVLSASTAAIDHGRKLSGYFSLHSSIILSSIETRALTDGVARLDPPGFEVAVEALFPPT